MNGKGSDFGINNQLNVVVYDYLIQTDCKLFHFYIQYIHWDLFFTFDCTDQLLSCICLLVVFDPYQNESESTSKTYWFTLIINFLTNLLNSIIRLTVNKTANLARLF